MNNTEKKEIMYKEIDLIQSCITRMSQNSFLIKGWLISLITVVLALLPEKIEIKILCLICIVIIFCFWYLDAFFLKIEKLFRWKYEWVIKMRVTSNEYMLDLNPYNSKMWLDTRETITEIVIKKKEPTIIKIMFTKTLLPLYIPLFLMVIITFINQYLMWF